MIGAATNVFKAKAFVETVRPVVEAYQRKELAILRPVNRFTGEVITEPKHAYTMDDDLFLLYIKGINLSRDEAGLKVRHPDNCPLLEAEGVERMAKEHLVNVMEPITKLSAHRLICSGLKNYEELIELTLRLLAPYCKA